MKHRGLFISGKEAIKERSSAENRRSEDSQIMSTSVTSVQESPVQIRRQRRVALILRTGKSINLTPF
jgi:hypothetical protein